MLTLEMAPRIAKPDDFYASLIQAHEGLDEDASLKLNAKLVLILANHIGDAGLFAQALELARSSSAKEPKE